MVHAQHQQFAETSIQKTVFPQPKLLKKLFSCVDYFCDFFIQNFMLTQKIVSENVNTILLG